MVNSNSIYIHFNLYSLFTDDTHRTAAKMLSPICVMVQPFLASFSPMNTGKASGKSLYSEKLTLRHSIILATIQKKSAVLQFDVPRIANAITLETFSQQVNSHLK